MDVSRTRALRGPNLWSRHMAIEAVVTCAENERAVGQMAGFEARLRAAGCSRCGGRKRCLPAPQPPPPW